MTLTLLALMLAVGLPLADVYAFEVAPGSTGNRLYLVLWNEEGAGPMVGVSVNVEGAAFTTAPVPIFVPEAVPAAEGRLAGFAFAVDPNTTSGTTGNLSAAVDATGTAGLRRVTVDVPLTALPGASPLQGIVGADIGVPGIADLDTDADGHLDQDEITAGSDPFDPDSTPAAPVPALPGSGAALALLLLATGMRLGMCRTAPALAAAAIALAPSPATADTSIQVVVSLSEADLGAVAWIPDPNDRELGLDELIDSETCDNGCTILLPNRTVDFTTEPAQPYAQGGDLAAFPNAMIRVRDRHAITFVAQPGTVIRWAPIMVNASSRTTFMRIEEGSTAIRFQGGTWRFIADATPDPNNPVQVKRLTGFRISDAHGVFFDRVDVSCQAHSQTHPGIGFQSDCRAIWGDGNQLEDPEVSKFTEWLHVTNSEIAGYRGLEFFYCDGCVAHGNLFRSPDLIDPTSPYDLCATEMFVKYVGVSNALTNNEFDGRRRNDGQSCMVETRLAILKRDRRPVAGFQKGGEFIKISDNTFFNMCGREHCGSRNTIGVKIDLYDVGEITDNTFQCANGRICDTYAVLLSWKTDAGPVNRFNRISDNRVLNFRFADAKGVVHFGGDFPANASQYDLSDPNNPNGNVANEISNNVFLLKNLDGTLQTGDPEAPAGVDFGVSGISFYLDSRNNRIYGNHTWGAAEPAGASAAGATYFLRDAQGAESIGQWSSGTVTGPALLVEEADPDFVGPPRPPMAALVLADSAADPSTRAAPPTGLASLAVVAPRPGERRPWLRAPMPLRLHSVECVCDPEEDRGAVILRLERRGPRAGPPDLLSLLRCGPHGDTGTFVEPDVEEGEWLEIAVGPRTRPLDHCGVTLSWSPTPAR